VQPGWLLNAFEGGYKPRLMSIDEKTVRKVAKLARLALSEDRVKPMADELNGIMAWIEQLNEVDIEGVEPMTSAVEGLSLPMRDAVVTAGDDPEKVLKTPKSEDGFFVVPKVVGDFTIAVESPLSTTCALVQALNPRRSIRRRSIHASHDG
jgi:aspartyl-tRNA(Asn)/glutamyl-tRNA(Gln) amidotransferase subunit C